MLNYCYVVEAGRLAKALAAHGLALSIGYLHSDKKGRNSLAWDTIEPLRPAIDAKVFAFIEAHEFARSDFPQSGYNVHRLSRDVTQLLLHKASLYAREIQDAAEWMVGAIVRSARAIPASVEAVERTTGRSRRNSASSEVLGPRSGRPFRCKVKVILDIRQRRSIACSRDTCALFEAADEINACQVKN
jgi:hypothetical protein